MLTFLTSHSHLINIMTVKNHHVIKSPHMRQLSLLRLAPNHAMHDTSTCRARARRPAHTVTAYQNVFPPTACPEICIETRTSIHFYHRLIRLAPISIYKHCTSYLQALCSNRYRGYGRFLNNAHQT